MYVKRISPAHREHGRDQKVGARAKWCISSAECGMKDCAISFSVQTCDSHMPHSAEGNPWPRNPILLCANPACCFHLTRLSERARSPARAVVDPRPWSPASPPRWSSSWDPANWRSPPTEATPCEQTKHDVIQIARTRKEN